MSYEEYVVIDGVRLNGLQNVSFDYSVGEEAMLNLGKSFQTTMITSAGTVQANIDKILTNTDHIITLTGEKNITGQFKYGENTLNFNSGVLRGYTVSASVGGLPEIAFDIGIYGDISGTNTLATYDDDNALVNIGQDDITVTFDKSSTNAVQGFTYSENYNFQPIYGLNKLGRPDEIKLIGPIVQELEVSIDVDDFEFEDIFSFLSGAKDRDRNVSVDIGGYNSFVLENAHLVGESKSLGVNDTVMATIRYRGYKKV
jgi:hypothetical protein